MAERAGIVSHQGAEIRRGRWEDVLADVGEVDAVITDPPFSARTHASAACAKRREGHSVSAITYTPWAPGDVDAFVSSWAPRCRGWMVAMTSHDLAPAWERSMEDSGLYVFAPLPFVEVGSRCRMAGDGPSSWCVWMVVARPRTREMARWGTLRGAYVVPAERGKGRVGGKPLAGMRQVVADYSRPGDLVVDPCAGAGTTLRACQLEGRRAIGAEMDEAAWRHAADRLRGIGPTGDRQQPSLFGVAP